MPFHARHFIKKMRGGAQAHLIEASDGNFYVVKFQNNPQHRRILVNEWVTSAILRHLKIQTPLSSIIEFSENFLNENQEVYIQLGLKQVKPQAAWHYGSRYPGHPHRMAVYDFLPDTLLDRIYNIREFSAVLAVDKWLGNTDSRQAVFFRAQIRDYTADSTEHPLRKSFLAQMIDHGYAFNGPNWEFQDAVPQGIYFRSLVYQNVTSMESFEPWLSQIAALPIEVMDEALRSLPPEWIAEDQPELESLLEKLWRRRTTVSDLLLRLRNSPASPFFNWLK